MGLGYLYLFSLATGLGILLLQMVLGGKGDAAHGGGDHGELDHEAEHHADKHLDYGGESAVALFLSTRFWIFFALAFGLAGSLLHFFGETGWLATLGTALFAGVGSGWFAAFAFRALKRSSASTSARVSDSVGQIGRVLVACTKGQVGQIRVELKGHSVDLMATTDELEIARGEKVLVEEIRGGVAHVSRQPAELA